MSALNSSAVLPKEVFESAKAVRINYKTLRIFDFAFSLDGQTIPAPGKSARIPVQLSSVSENEDAGAFAKRCAMVATESLQTGNKDSIHWVFTISRQTETLMEDLHASRRMIAQVRTCRGSATAPRWGEGPPPVRTYEPRTAEHPASLKPRIQPGVRRRLFSGAFVLRLAISVMTLLP